LYRPPSVAVLLRCLDSSVRADPFMRLASEAQLDSRWCVARRRGSDACPEAIDEDPNYNRIFIAFPVERNSGMDTVIWPSGPKNNARTAISRQSDPMNTNAYSNVSTTMRSRDAALALIGGKSVEALFLLVAQLRKPGLRFPPPSTMW
jgi:hypothetical protein